MSSNIKKKLSEALHNSNNHQTEEDERLNLLSISNIEDIDTGNENQIYSIALNQNGSKAAIGLDSGSLQLFNCYTWERIRKVRTSLSCNLPLVAVKFYPCLTRDVVFTAGSDGMIKTWNLDSCTLGNTSEELGNQIMSLDFSNDGAFFATGGKDACVRLYDSDTLTLYRSYKGSNHFDIDSFNMLSEIPGHSQKVFSVKFLPDDKNLFITASWDRKLKVWDLRLKNAVKSISGPFVCGDGLDVSHNTILTASWVKEDALQLWDFSSGRLISNLDFQKNNGGGEYLYCCRFWNDKFVIAGGSGTNDLKLINIISNKVVDFLNALYPVQCIEVFQKHELLLCGTSRNFLRAKVF
ncbi:WD repeat-containing protein tag-125-like [Hydra vulgaris]|uniref:WD repeat-containing protein tag-125-like n=1 Tax=Hydra vulgaris TaxID=6087 RepID=A0ABM4BW37_HYDVU